MEEVVGSQALLSWKIAIRSWDVANCFQFGINSRVVVTFETLRDPTLRGEVSFIMSCHDHRLVPSHDETGMQDMFNREPSEWRILSFSPKLAVQFLSFLDNRQYSKTDRIWTMP